MELQNDDYDDCFIPNDVEISFENCGSAACRSTIHVANFAESIPFTYNLEETSYNQTFFRWFGNISGELHKYSDAALWYFSKKEINMISKSYRLLVLCR